MSEIKLYAYDFGWPLVEIPVEFMTFPGGEEHVKVDPTDLHTRANLVIDARISDSSGILRVLVLNDAITRLSAAFVALFCPYLPGARQDRGAPLSAKVYADLINSAGFDQVIAVDPHSDVMPALINRLDIIPIEDVIQFPQPVFVDDSMFLIPDAGAGKRAYAVAEKFGFRHIAQALKHRDPATGKLSGFEIHWPDHRDVRDIIIVDDICDGGGTFLGLAEVIAQDYAPVPRLHLWTTHGIYSKGLGELANVFHTITSTDSFPIPQQALDVMPGSKSLTRFPLKRILEGKLESTRYYQ